MNVEWIVLLFLGFSVVSTLINKFREYQNRQDQPQSRPTTVYEPEEEEIDFSEWEVFQSPQESEAPGEFQEIRGARPVSEEYSGEEFQEVHGKRPVEEDLPAVEFRRPEVSVAPDARAEEVVIGYGKKRKRIKLTVSRKALRNAVIFNEVIGPPRAENMPW